MSDQANWCSHGVRDPDVCRKCFPQFGDGFVAWAGSVAVCVAVIVILTMMLL